MTTFILVGGSERAFKDYGYNLNKEIARHVSNPKILSCFFSWPRDSWEEKAKVWEDWLSNNLQQSFMYGYAKVDTFLQQVDGADVIYFHGGDTARLLKTLPDTTTLKQHLKGKVVIGSSAGANMLSACFWSSKRAVLGEGRGIIDTCIMVHYGAPNVDGRKRTKADWRREEAAFQEHIGDRVITKLPEGQFVVVEEGA